MNEIIKNCLNELRNRKFILIYDSDGREEETDFVIPSVFVRNNNIRTMRKDGGGLICMTISYEAAEILSLPVLTDLLKYSTQKYSILKNLISKRLPYDAKSSFSITINHIDNFTGITDIDRAMTISEFGKTISKLNDGTDKEKLKLLFENNFRAPGHVHLLIAERGLLKSRRGHTELSTAMMILAGLPPSACICEMLSDDGRALSKNDVKKYAEKHNLMFIEGAQIVEAWNEWSE